MECPLQEVGGPGMVGVLPEESGYAGTHGRYGHGCKAGGALPEGVAGLAPILKSQSTVCRC